MLSAKQAVPILRDEVRRLQAENLMLQRELLKEKFEKWGLGAEFEANFIWTRLAVRNHGG